MKPLQVVVFDVGRAYDVATDKVRDHLAARDHLVSHVVDPSELAGALESGCDMLVVYVPEEPERTLRALRIVHDTLPALPIVLVGGESLSIDLGDGIRPEHLIATGASGLISADADFSVVAETLDRAGRLAVRGRLWASNLVNGTSPTLGQLHVVTSTGGGTGRTFMATTIASYLSSIGRTTCIIDLDAPYGDVSLALQTPTRFTVADAVGAEIDEVAEHLPSLCQKVRPGLFVLSGSAPEVPVPTGPEARSVVTAARRIYDHVVVDAPHTPSPITNALLDDATDIWCVQTADLGSIRAVKLLQENLSSAGVEPERTRIVVNKFHEAIGLDLENVARVLGQEPALVIPHDLAVAQSLNDGNPLVLRDQRGTAEALRAGLALHLDTPDGSDRPSEDEEHHLSERWSAAGWAAAGAAVGSFTTFLVGAAGWI